MIRSLLVSLLLIAPTVGSAAIHCVSNATQFRNALATAASNGEADEIRLARATFLATASQRFWMHLNEPFGLQVSGGWTPLFNGACGRQGSDATATILDGSGQVAVLDITVTSQHSFVPVTIENLTLRNGFTSTATASGLAVMGVYDSSPAIMVDRVIVHDNVSTVANIPAVYLVSDDHLVRFSNSIVRHNSMHDAPAVWLLSNDGGTAMNHVSVIYNSRNVGGGMAQVLGIGGAQISGSLFWGNSAGDLYASGNVRYYNNRYGVGSDEYLFGQLGFGNYIIADPALQSPTLPRPLAHSVLRNVGSSTIGTRDVYGQPRLLGGYSDIGAAEFIE